MGSRTSTVVHLSNESDVDELVSHISAQPGQHVFVTVDEASDALLTAPEFFRVARAARAAEVSISIATEDPLREELASMLGWGLVPASSEDTEETETDTTTDLATYRPTVLPDLDPPAQTEREDPAAPAPAHERTMGAQPIGRVVPEIEALARARAARRLQEPLAQPAAGTRERPARRARRPANHDRLQARPSADSPVTHHRAGGRLLRVTTAVILVLVAAFGVMDAVMVLLPTATIQLVPAEHTVAVDLVYGIARPGATYDITVNPTSVGHTISVSRSIPTTGARTEPDGTASGTVQLLNPSTTPVTVPVGTKLKGANGTTYSTESGVTVPGADPFGSASMGSASVEVSADSGGSGGNAGAAVVAGQLASGVYFKNNAAITGGTDKRIPVVAQADLDALHDAALADLSSRAETEFKQSLDKSLELVPNSIATGEPNLAFSQRVGDDADSVSVTATETVSAQAFDPAKLTAQAKEEAGRRLAAQVRTSAEVVPDSVRMGEPQPLDGGVSFSVRAEARATNVISEQTRSDLARRVVGRSLADAQREAQMVDGVASTQIDLGPKWLTNHVERMPRQAKRITVSSETTGSRPAGRP